MRMRSSGAVYAAQRCAVCVRVRGASGRQCGVPIIFAAATACRHATPCRHAAAIISFHAAVARKARREREGRQRQRARGAARRYKSGGSGAALYAARARAVRQRGVRSQ